MGNLKKNNGYTFSKNQKAQFPGIIPCINQEYDDVA